MCKLFIATDVSKMNKEDLNSMINIVEEFFYKSERDGFSITTKSHGEPVDFYKFINKKNDILIDNINSLILHGRTSTNSVSLINTHPIQVDDIFLSHNGVVQDLNLDYELKTSNDTEYLTYRINQGINAVEKNIRGYYAATFVRDSNNELVIFRDDIAPLYFVWSEEFESFFYCTSRVLLEKLFLVEASSMPENTLLKYIGNELIETVKFNPGGSSVYADNLAHLSLGNSTEDRFSNSLKMN